MAKTVTQPIPRFVDEARKVGNIRRDPPRLILAEQRDQK
jgi:hypothetical protein